MRKGKLTWAKEQFRAILPLRVTSKPLCPQEKERSVCRQSQAENAKLTVI